MTGEAPEHFAVDETTVKYLLDRSNRFGLFSPHELDHLPDDLRNEAMQEQEQRLETLLGSIMRTVAHPHHVERAWWDGNKTHLEYTRVEEGSETAMQVVVDPSTDPARIVSVNEPLVGKLDASIQFPTRLTHSGEAPVQSGSGDGAQTSDPTVLRPEHRVARLRRHVVQDPVDQEIHLDEVENDIIANGSHWGIESPSSETIDAMDVHELEQLAWSNESRFNDALGSITRTIREPDFVETNVDGGRFVEYTRLGEGPLAGVVVRVHRDGGELRFVSARPLRESELNGSGKRLLQLKRGGASQSRDPRRSSAGTPRTSPERGASSEGGAVKEPGKPVSHDPSVGTRITRPAEGDGPSRPTDGRQPLQPDRPVTRPSPHRSDEASSNPQDTTLHRDPPEDTSTSGPTSLPRDTSTDSFGTAHGDDPGLPRDTSTDSFGTAHGRGTVAEEHGPGWRESDEIQVAPREAGTTPHRPGSEGRGDGGGNGHGQGREEAAGEGAEKNGNAPKPVKVKGNRNGKKEDPFAKWAEYAGPKKAERDRLAKEANAVLERIIRLELRRRSWRVEKIVGERLLAEGDRRLPQTTRERILERLHEMRKLDMRVRREIFKLERTHRELWRDAGNAEFERGHGYGERVARLTAKQRSTLKEMREEYKTTYEKLGEIGLERERWRLYAEGDKATTYYHSSSLGGIKVKNLKKLSPDELKKVRSDLGLGRLPESHLQAKRLVAQVFTEASTRRPDQETGVAGSGEERPRLTKKQATKVLSHSQREIKKFAELKRAEYVKRLTKLYDERDDLIDGKIKAKLMSLKRVRQFYGVRPKDVKFDEKTQKWVPTTGQIYLGLTYRPGANNVSKAISSVEMGYVAADGFLASHGGFGWADVGGRSVDDGFDMGWTAGFYIPFGWLSPTVRSLLRRRWLIRPLVGKILGKREDPRDPMEWIQTHILDERGGAPFSKPWVKALSMTYTKQALWLGPTFLLNVTLQADVLHPGQLSKLVNYQTPSAALPNPTFPTPPSIPPVTVPPPPPPPPSTVPSPVVIPSAPVPYPAPDTGSAQPFYPPVPVEGPFSGAPVPYPAPDTGSAQPFYPPVPTEGPFSGAPEPYPAPV